MRLVCWVVGLVLFASIKVLLLVDVIVVIVFLRCGIFGCVWVTVVDLGGGLCRLEL